MIVSLLTALFFGTAILPSASLTPTPRQVLAPQTGDINVMIIVAVILIAAFMMFILLKSKRKDR
ncbi:MAG: LPXTG cell wall anchor domain-containing protein [Ruminococcaceae bacterium]|nr:LPXTG cell wall anchor domain-containing protein [Oscillospiraceae bacterium]